MKKSLALVLALIMVMGCMSFAAAEGERTVTLNRSNLKCLQGICDVKSVDEKNGAIALTYFITEEPEWKMNLANIMVLNSSGSKRRWVFRVKGLPLQGHTKIIGSQLPVDISLTVHS